MGPSQGPIREATSQPGDPKGGKLLFLFLSLLPMPWDALNPHNNSSIITFTFSEG